MSIAPRTISCGGGCGALHLADEIESSGWDFLEISGRYRCGACTRALRAASFIPGTEPGAFVDALPPSSRGALPKETASTIAPPALKG